MLRYSIKRILLALLTVLIIAAITFFAMNAIPGGPFSSEKAIDPATLAALEARYGLDKPLGEQFVNYLRNLLHGDLGVSLKTGREISDVIGESFGVSARLGLMAARIAACMASPCWISSVGKTVSDNVATSFSKSANARSSTWAQRRICVPTVMPSRASAGSNWDALLRQDHRGSLGRTAVKTPLP